MNNEIEAPIGMTPERWAEYKAAIEAAVEINEFDWGFARSLIGDLGLIRSSEGEQMEAGQRVRIKAAIGDFDPPLNDTFGYLERKDPDKPENWWVRMIGPLYGITLTFSENDLEVVEGAERMEQQPFSMGYSTYYPSVVEEKKEYIYIVTTPTNDRITVKAVDCFVQRGCLIFDDADGVTVKAVAAGHWVLVDRQETEEE